VCSQEKALKAGEIYEVAKILKKEVGEDGETRYLCTWKGYKDVSWETAENLRISAARTLTEFNALSRTRNTKGQPKRKRTI